jgi:cytochrome c-type biogenesis protein CcmH/NrfG
MNKNMVLAALGGLLVGVLLGYTIGLSKGLDAAMAIRGGGAPEPMGPVPGGMPGLAQPMPQAGGPPAPSPQQVAEAQQRIAMNQVIVAKDPKNVAAWIGLGNDYFDTRQFQKAIDAYAAALKLQPANPDVLTDQGVMYEQLADYDRALANFEQAQKVDPKHVQSLYNIGVVWSRHKNDPIKAAAAWKKVVELAPQSSQAAEARTGLSQLGR